MAITAAGPCRVCSRLKLLLPLVLLLGLLLGLGGVWVAHRPPGPGVEIPPGIDDYELLIRADLQRLDAALQRCQATGDPAALIEARRLTAEIEAARRKVHALRYHYSDS